LGLKVPYPHGTKKPVLLLEVLLLEVFEPEPLLDV
jgi:hypothetical protein